MTVDLIEVVGPAGVTFHVRHEVEKDFVEQMTGLYEKDFAFTNTADLQELDRLIRLELIAHRCTSWALQEADYWGGPVDAVKLKKEANEISSEIRQIKKDLGINKLNRDKDKGTGVAEYIENLGTRAKAFGYKRNAEYFTVLDLFTDLAALVTFHKNCTEEEQKEYRCTKDDVIDWIQNVAIPKFQEHDIEFRKEQQAWIREM